MKFLSKIRGKTKPMSRESLLMKFNELINLDKCNDEREALIIGGTNADPEVEILKKSNWKVTFAGLDVTNDFKLDLNHPSEQFEKYDLIVASQVLEHVHNLENAALNFSKLSRKGTRVWISVPASNFRHGSPEYYSAGYSREFLKTLFIRHGFEVISCGEISNQRIYYFRHILQLWPSVHQLHHPVFSYYGIDGSYWEKILYNFSHIPTRIVLLISSAKSYENDDFGIETYGLFMRSE